VNANLQLVTATQVATGDGKAAQARQRRAGGEREGKGKRGITESGDGCGPVADGKAEEGKRGIREGEGGGGAAVRWESRDRDGDGDGDGDGDEDDGDGGEKGQVSAAAGRRTRIGTMGVTGQGWRWGLGWG
ncbi:hypothetical protein ACLOJK_022549, partial [Asimina triloba]